MRTIQQLGVDTLESRLYENTLAESIIKKLQRQRIVHETAVLRQARRQLDERSLMQFCNKCLKKYKKKVAKCNECGGSGFHKAESLPLDSLVNPIAFIGIEFEGAWTYNPQQSTSQRRKDKISYSLDMKSDGSVEVDDDDDDFVHVGEITTEPIPWTSEGKNKIKHIIRNSYPDIVNNTCGGHFHMSLKDPSMLVYLLDREYYDGWISSLKRFAEDNLTRGQNGELEERWGNSYCQDLFDPEIGITGSGDRYAYLNYLSWHNRKTLEFRILPMFENKEAYWKCLNLLLSYTEDFLRDRFWLGKKTVKQVNIGTKDPFLKTVETKKYVAKRLYTELVSAYDKPERRRR